MDLHVRSLFLSIFFSLTYAVLSTNSTNKPVYFSLIVSRGENGFRSSGAIPAIHIALEEIERHQLLPGYNLTYETAGNSKVDIVYLYTHIANLRELLGRVGLSLTVLQNLFSVCSACISIPSPCLFILTRSGT